MLYIHREQRPRVDPSAVVTPTAVIAGDVTIGPACHVGFGAVLVAEGAPIRLGASVIVREHALLRSTASHPLHVGSYVLIGPRAALYGCTVEDEVFLATGVTIFHGAHVGAGAEVRVNGSFTSPRMFRPGKWCRSAGSRSGTPPASCLRELTTRSGPSSKP